MRHSVYFLFIVLHISVTYNQIKNCYLEADLTGEGDGEDVVCLAEVVVAGVGLVHGVLSRDAEGGEADHDHDELVEGGGADEPVNQLPHAANNYF